MNKLYILPMLGIILVTGVLAEDYYKVNVTTDLKFTCTLNYAIPSPTTSFNITISHKLNGTILVNNKAATPRGQGAFNYTFRFPESGEYTIEEFCYDGSYSNSNSETVTVNPQGIPPSQMRTEAMTRAIYIIFTVAVLLFIGFLFTREKIPVKWTFFILAVIFFVIGLNLTFISLTDEVVNPKIESFFDSFSAISFYFYWFAAGTLIFLWFFTFINTWLYKENINKLRRFGGD